MNASVLTKDQTKTFVTTWTEEQYRYCLTTTIRYDDRCDNGHNTFSITADLHRNGREDCCGCLHDLIAERMPELAPYIKWHLVSSDGPMHYIANTVYHASDRDHWGLRKGEERQHRSKSGVPQWKLKSHESYVTSEDKPPAVEWEPWMQVGKGKERRLDYARSTAVWPEATDDELMSDKIVLESMLKARLPKLMEEFREAVESLGFVY